MPTLAGRFPFLQPLADLFGFGQGSGGQLPALLPGGIGSRIITGTGADDLLIGTTGRDIMTGGTGNDTLYGGGGGDILAGGRGADLFSFAAPTDSRANPGNRDVITDFNRNEGDLIDLTALGALNFNDSGRFGGTAGEIIATATRGGTLVQVDLDGDLRADFSVMVTGATSIRASDFAVVTIE